MGTETYISLSIRIYIHINMRHTILPERAPMAPLLPSPRCMVYQGDREETIGPTRSRPHLRVSTPTIGGGRGTSSSRHADTGSAPTSSAARLLHAHPDTMHPAAQRPEGEPLDSQERRFQPDCLQRLGPRRHALRHPLRLIPAPGAGLHHHPRPPVGRKMAEESWQSPLPRPTFKESG